MRPSWLLSSLTVAIVRDSRIHVRSALWIDFALILNLRNQPAAIQMSSSKSKVKLRHHLRWFKAKENRQSTLLVFDKWSVLGYVRFSRTPVEGDFVWSFAKLPMRRHVGYVLTSAALRHFLASKKPNRIIGIVNERNVSSLVVHKKLGFQVKLGSTPGTSVGRDEILLILEVGARDGH